MNLRGVERVTYGADDLAAARRFFLDWGLTLLREDERGLDFEARDGGGVRVRRKDDPELPPALEPGATVREVLWGVASEDDLEAVRRALDGAPGFRPDPPSCLDPSGLAVSFAVSRRRAVDAPPAAMNRWGRIERLDAPSAFYQAAQPLEVSHVVFVTDALAAAERFYVERLGFHVSDRYVDRGVFLRCAAEGTHHDLFFLSQPGRRAGLHHVAFTVRDIHEVFGGGLHASRCGWTSELGPGRHPVSSAYFWYVKCPAGGLVEYVADEDVLTGAWQPRALPLTAESFTEWAIAGGLDAKTRRQVMRPK